MRTRVPVPPWIGIITVMLASVFFVPMMIFGDWQGLAFTNEPIALRILYWLTMPFFFGFIFWHSCIALLRRRMGMTRLAVSLTLFTGVFGFYLLGRTGWIPAVTARTNAVQFSIIPTFVLTCIIGIGCVALAIVILLRPEDLLRWCPTGKAWDSYRRGRVIRIPDLPTRFAELRRFQLLHDAEDAPAAARFRAELIRAGTVEASIDATSVALLTNRTTTAWLSQHAELLQKSVVTVIGSAIGLPPSLHWLWRRQWIDLRRWDATRRRKNPVPAVPEGMTRLRIPAVVRLNEHLFCAMAGLLGVLANVAFSPDSSKSDTLTPRDWFRRADRCRLHILDRCCVAADSSPDHSTALRPKNRDFVLADTYPRPGWTLFFCVVRRKRMARRSRGRLRARPAIFPSLANGAPGVLVPGTACTGHEICVTPERPAKMGRAALGLSFTWDSGCCSSAYRCEASFSFVVSIQPGSLGYARDD